MKISTTLKKAAELVDNHKEPYACWAIHKIVWDRYNVREKDKATEFFRLYFCPKNDGKTVYGWFGDFNRIVNRQRRVTALLLASAIAKSEGL